MNETANKKFDNGRRRLLLGAIAVTAASVLQAYPGRAVASTVATPAPIPANQVNLSDFGGVPGASSQNIIGAFNQAFNVLKSLGGGTLNVVAGTYNLGNMSGGTAISVSDLKNVLISAYGAQLTMTTTSGTPTFLSFQNPNNVTIAGLAFRDFGTNIRVEWLGGICLVVTSTRACSGFKTVGCVAESVVAFLQSQPSSQYRYMFEQFDIQATIRNSYYGVNPNYSGRYSRCDLTCFNVRRAFIAYGARDWNISVKGDADGSAPGSNAFIELAANGTDVSDVAINLTVTGNMRNYRGLVTLYHQSSTSSLHRIRNVKAYTTLNNMSGAAQSVYLFPYEPPGSGAFASTTISTWEQIQLNASVVGSYSGPMIQNPSVSTSSTNLINVASGLAARENMSSLPKYFNVITQCSA